jgi:hypothetical protein
MSNCIVIDLMHSGAIEPKTCQAEIFFKKSSCLVRVEWLEQLMQSYQCRYKEAECYRFVFPDQSQLITTTDIMPMNWSYGNFKHKYNFGDTPHGEFFVNDSILYLKTIGNMGVGYDSHEDKFTIFTNFEDDAPVTPVPPIHSLRINLESK